MYSGSISKVSTSKIEEESVRTLNLVLVELEGWSCFYTDKGQMGGGRE